MILDTITETMTTILYDLKSIDTKNDKLFISDVEILMSYSIKLVLLTQEIIMRKEINSEDQFKIWLRTQIDKLRSDIKSLYFLNLDYEEQMTHDVGKYIYDVTNRVYNVYKEYIDILTS